MRIEILSPDGFSIDMQEHKNMNEVNKKTAQDLI